MARTPKQSNVGNEAGSNAGSEGTSDSANKSPIDAIREDAGKDDGNKPIDPAAAIGDDDGYARDGDGNIIYKRDGSPAKRRGRKSGSGNSASGSSGRNRGNSGASAASDKQTLNTAIETLSFAIGGLHLAIAAFTKSPEMVLDDSETLALAKSTVNVLNQFDLSPDPRIVAIAGLMATAAQVYGPRFIVIKQRRKEERNSTVTVKPNSVTVKDAPNFADPNMFNFQG